jgi:3-oxoacyl-[acyl-carrier protein] reductase
MNLNLRDKIALITGGSRGIGRACAMLLAEAGAKVYINYKKSKEKAEQALEEITRLGSDAEIFQADVSVPEEVQGLFQYIKEKSTRLDILVNNAGLIKDNLLLTMKLADWDRVHDVNLRGSFLCTKFAAEMMMPRHAGKIINIASVGAIKGGRGQTNYASAKGGLIAFTRACAVELGGKGIQVNAILPGLIVTDMSQRIRKRAGEEILTRIPAARYGDPTEVANLVLFLASDKSDYITGQAIAIDGGLSIS